MRAIPILIPFILLAAPTSAGHCETWTTSEPEIDTGDTPLGQYYVDNDMCQFECVFSVWIYQETNGIPGLQRGDEVVDDTCHGMIDSDTLDG